MNKKTQLPDAQRMGVKTPDGVVQLWKKRFKQSEDFRRPYIEKNLRMYKLYRAYRDKLNYAYQTNIMPPIGFEVIETVKPRIASSKINVNIWPRDPSKKEIEHGIGKWSDLTDWNLQEMEFEDKKKDWIHAMLLYGNGIAQVTWEGNHTGLEIVDNWLFYPDPYAQNRLRNSRWEIKQSFKNLAVIEREEKEREKKGGPEARLYDEDKIERLKEAKELQDETSEGKDPRQEREEINTLKMSQVDGGKQDKGDTKNTRGDGYQDKEATKDVVEIWECWDHVTGKLQVVFNRKYLVRNEDNPYKHVLDGRPFIDLVDISNPWEFYAMGHLEPIETIIHEIADSRNQAMDSIVFNLDPITKVKKNQGYKAEDLKRAPGAIWELNNENDVQTERPIDISGQWINKDDILRREIETSLALGEYVRGMPKSSQEPASKVEMLLTQTNIRFSSIVRNYEVALTDLVNAIIEMNQKMATEDVTMRILGDKFKHESFTARERQISVDARVSIDPKREKSVQQEAQEAMTLYEMLVVNDPPQEPEAQAKWQEKKQLLQRIIVEKFGLEDYAEVLAPEPEPQQPQPQPQPQQGAQAPPTEPAGDEPIPLLQPEPLDVEPAALQEEQLSELLG